MTARIPDQKDDHQLLYHVKRTINDFSQDLSGATQTTDILNTFTNLDAAKSAALTSLFSQGYLKDDFIKYEENDRTQELKHGDGVMVFAKGPSGREFYIGLDTTPNVFFFQGNAFGEVEGPLYYVLQTTIYYNDDRTGGIQKTEVRSMYLTRKEAEEFGKDILIDEDVSKESFAEYDEKDRLKDDWPYGDDVLIHAVSEIGENIKILVTKKSN